MRIAPYLIAAICISCAGFNSYDSFFRAVVGEDVVQIQELVARGFDPNARDPDGQPAIIRALRADAPRSALALAQLPGTDVNVRNKAGETPLMMAALKGQPEVCQALIARGAEVRLSGWTPLHYAAAGNSLAVTQFLLRQGADVDARAPNGRTALMLAALHGSEEIVDTLLAAGADAAASDRNANQAADLAELAGRERLAARLEARAKQGSR